MVKSTRMGGPNKTGSGYKMTQKIKSPQINRRRRVSENQAKFLLQTQSKRVVTQPKGARKLLMTQSGLEKRFI